MSTVERMSRLALGTVQFGLSYGVANQSGQVSPEEVGLILDAARNSGVRTLDTATAYGESEKVLGQQDLRGFAVVTKLPEIPADCVDVSAWVEAQLHTSLVRLGLSAVDGLLLHRPAQLLGAHGAALFAALQAQREQGLVRRIGVSVYSPEELDTLCQRYHFDLIQAPFNVLDKRLEQSGWLDRLQREGTDLHVRSVFMQGLLLMPSEERPAKFARWQPLWALWQRWLAESGQSPLQACLRHALAVPQIERVVVGVDSLAQWQAILQSAAGPCPVVPSELQCADIELLNPSLWNHL
ncbi:aldo/keto reductase [Ectopseudomonas mendocina]|uniref:Aldo/keto reductase n=1 Tax=Ectopseudomonas mendocina TaxID=300 RepID=A0ABD7RTI3_ECTME|nr:aldo/keto reductase [Pseudomonas mendocina]TRO12864.1 aldo/keto reductase [Pseudomonas mendocina]TRO15729.1 aldo/keto reductase [Pseudomonas mendocina]